MIVVDSSAIIGAHHAHYLPDSIAGFWDFFDAAWRRGELVVPLAVLDELATQSDDAHRWVKEREDLIAVPDEHVQRFAGELLDRFRFREDGDGADPFVIAEAHCRKFAVATYEGRSPTGNVAKAKAGLDNMPTICEAIGVRCFQPGEAWRHAGLRL